MSQSWGQSSATTKHSQVSLDMFEQWKREQQEEISNRGADKNRDSEELYNQHMLRQNLNAYICHKELDKYTTCLQEKNLIVVDGSSNYEINTKNKLNEKLCKSTHFPYVRCMSSKENQELLLQHAALHPLCQTKKLNVLSCMEKNADIETKTNVPQCEESYRSLLRCGLNHLWNEYWRALTKFTDKEDFQLYELSRDENKSKGTLEW
ncbi:hypothetical protein AGDE_11662 [Angomonas deanei]|nr:hypothetical protein AGDE_11662 [Angomonas deanei]|eukprot:EPY25858.1 hypothetical protein AGDE_11662 [Angomonas deanei]